MTAFLQRLFAFMGWFNGAIILFFTFRRWFLTLIALWQSAVNARLSTDLESPSPPQTTPPVLLLIPLRNESRTLPGLLAGLDQLEYSPHLLTIVLINDGSKDDSEPVIQAWVKDRPNCYSLSLARNIGKSAALNMAAQQFPQGEIIAVYDADERPAPNALRALVQPFEDAQVGAASGRRMVGNALASPAASYTAIEGIVHQFITTQAKDWLNLAPPILGANCAYRREALAQVGYFQPDILLEDSDLTIKLARQGWTIRFATNSISYHAAPETLFGYWQQHTRWARGFNEVAKTQGFAPLHDTKLPLMLRLELLIFSWGYLDRVALMMTILYCFFRVIVPRTAQSAPKLLISAIILNLLTPFCQTLIALRLAKQPFAMWQQVFWLPLFFIIDIAMSAAGLWNTVRNTPQIWEERNSRL